MPKLTVGNYMTPAPHTIGVEQTVQAAADLMREHHIRHLPVPDLARRLMPFFAQAGLLGDRSKEGAPS